MFGCWILRPYAHWPAYSVLRLNLIAYTRGCAQPLTEPVASLSSLGFILFQLIWVTESELNKCHS